MGWEKRKSKSYFYLHRRLSDGRKVKEYFGRGFHANMASGFLQLRKVATWMHQQAMSELKAETQEADELLNNYSESVSEFVADKMSAVGYHNSRSRGWRRMMKTDLNAEKEITKDAAVNGNKAPKRSKGTSSKSSKDSKAASSPVSQKRAGSTANPSGSPAPSPGRSTAQVSEAKAKRFRMASAAPSMNGVGYSEISDIVETELPPPAKPVEEMSPDELTAAATEGDSAAMNRLRPMMQKNPSHFQQIGDLGALAEEQWLHVHYRKNLYFRECLKGHIDEMRAQHLEEGNSPIERLLIEEVLLTWLRHNYWISWETSSLQKTPGSKVLKFSMDQTRGAQRMYLKAIAELRDFRKLKSRLPSATASSVAETD
jgi:hypothetical protein